MSTTDPPEDRRPRGAGLYDRWSDHDYWYRSLMRLAAPLRDAAFDAATLEADERVLDLGCGPGTNFERVRDAVGPDGHLVGLDYSDGMVDRARDRVRDHGWANVDVVQGDASAYVCDDPVDVALTTFALHTMTDVESVVENVYESLQPGGRFVVLDSREFQTPPLTALNPLFERALALTVDHQRDQAPLAALRDTFQTTDVVETFDAGAGYLAVARKRAD